MLMKRKVLKIIGLIIIYVLISCIIYLILDLSGLTSVNKIRNLISKAGGWGYLAFFVFQVITSTFVCIIPFEDELLVTVALILFGPIKGFLIASFNMFATSSLQFLIGRFLCRDIVIKFLGKESLNKYEESLKIKGELMLPVLYAIPLFPHDSLCFLAGMSKMKYWYFAIITLIMRSLEIACICFLGSGLIDFSALSILDWIILINVFIIDIYLMCKLKDFIETKLNKK